MTRPRHQRLVDVVSTSRSTFAVHGLDLRVMQHSCSDVQVSAPHGATDYVRAAMEFANWAFMSDEDHDAAADAQRAVTATLAATQRLQTLCDYSLSSTAPPSAAQPGDGGEPPLALCGAAKSPSLPQRTHSAPLSAAACTESSPLATHSRHASLLSTPSLQAERAPQPDRSTSAAAVQSARPDFVDENTGGVRGSGAWSSGVRSSGDSAAHLQAMPAAQQQTNKLSQVSSAAQASGADALVTPQLGQVHANVRNGAGNAVVSTGVPDPEMVMATGGDVRFTCGAGADKHACYAATPEQQGASGDAALPELPVLPESCSPGDRDTVVEQWLKRNAAMLARLQ